MKTNTLVRVLLGCACLGVTILFSPCATATGIPKDKFLSIVAEIHGNTSIPEYPEDCLVKGAYLFPFDDLQNNHVVIVRKDDGSTVLAKFAKFICGNGGVTKDNFIAVACGVYDTVKIGPEPIPLSFWETDKPIPGTTRILVEPGLTGSMYPMIPKDHKVLMTVTLGVPYKSLRSGGIVIYWSSSAKTFPLHRLVAHFSGERWTTQGDNCAFLPKVGYWTKAGVAYTPTIKGKGGIDSIPMTPATYVAVAHRVVTDPTKLTTGTLVANTTN